MSKSIERYLESIGHTGPWENDNHKCSCSKPTRSAQATPQTFVRINANGERIPEAIKETHFTTPNANQPVTKRTDTRTIKVGNPQAPVTKMDAVLTATNANTGIIPPPIAVESNNVIADVMAPTNQNTGIVPPVIQVEENTMQTLPVIAENNPISQTGASKNTTAASAGDTTKKAGAWLLGLLLAGYVVKSVFGSDKKEKE